MTNIFFIGAANLLLLVSCTTPSATQNTATDEQNVAISSEEKVLPKNFTPDSPEMVRRSDSTTEVVAKRLDLNAEGHDELRVILMDYYREVAQVLAAHERADEKAPDYFDDYEVQLSALEKVYRDRITAAFPNKAEAYRRQPVVLVK